MTEFLIIVGKKINMIGWDYYVGIAMAVNLDAVLINVIVNIIILSPVLWLVGRALAGKDKAKFTDAIIIVVVGTLVGLFSATSSQA